MSTDALPFDSAKSARAFYKRMQQPWIAKVTRDEDSEDYTYDVPGLSALYEGDDIFMQLCYVADKKKKDFDIRPTMKYMLCYLMNELEFGLCRPAPLPVLNLVRKALGMKELRAEPVYRGPQRIAQKILELLAAHNIKCTGDGHKGRYHQLKPARSTTGSKKPTHSYAFIIDPSIDSLEKLQTALSPLKQLGIQNIKDDWGQIKIRFNTKLAGKFKLDAERTDFHLRYQKGKSDKFWYGQCKGNKLVVKFGRTDTEGRIIQKKFTNPKAALVGLQRLVRKKRDKGYRDVG